MAMGMTLMQQTYQRLTENYDENTAQRARAIHGIYCDALRGAQHSGKELSVAVMNSRVVPEAEKDYLQYIELVQRAISNQ